MGDKLESLKDYIMEKKRSYRFLFIFDGQFQPGEGEPRAPRLYLLVGVGCVLIQDGDQFLAGAALTQQVDSILIAIVSHLEYGILVKNFEKEFELRGDSGDFLDGWYGIFSHGTLELGF